MGGRPDGACTIGCEESYLFMPDSSRGHPYGSIAAAFSGAVGVILRRPGFDLQWAGRLTSFGSFLQWNLVAGAETGGDVCSP